MWKKIKVVDARFDFQSLRLRTPLKFGGSIVEAVTSATATVRVKSPDGREAEGKGNILLSDLWAFPAPAISHERKDTAMRAFCQEFACKALGAQGHPIEIYLSLKEELTDMCRATAERFSLEGPFPLLAGIVCSSPIDAGVHDAFGKLNGVSSYDACSKEFMEFDLSRYLGKKFKGLYPADFLRREFVKSLPVFHLVGGVDKLRESEVDDSDPKDCLPVSLEEWIRRDGVYCFKVKLRGNDLQWDIERTIDIYRVATEILQRKVYLSADSNEMCESPDCVVEYLKKLKERDEACFNALLYYEQPTERELSNHRFDMRAVSMLKCVLADEGVTDVASFRLAIELGWSGIALKTCKGHTSSLLYIAMCGKEGMPYSVQDLTNVGLGLVHSAGLAGRSSPILGFEYNARQYLPHAEEEIQRRHASLFRVVGGRVSTESLSPLGLGYSFNSSTI